MNCTDLTCVHAARGPHTHDVEPDSMNCSGPKHGVNCNCPVMRQSDAINHVAHYNAGKIECIDAMEAAIVGQTAFEGALTSTAIKYCWRWKHKNGVEDVKKAVWYLNRLIAHLEKQ